MNDGPRNDVVLVEDNAFDAELVLRAMRRCTFLGNVEWLRDGSELLDYLHCTGAHASRDPLHSPRLILLDLKMPKVDGLDVLRSLRDDPSARTIPIVMITSSGEERDIVESYALGVNSFIVKPVETDELGEVMNAICVYWLHLNRVPTP
jgi:CheY-like chemotaxis protein